MMLFTTVYQPKLYIRGNPLYHRLRNNISESIDISNDEFYRNFILFTKAINKYDRYYFKKSDLKLAKVDFKRLEIILTINGTEYRDSYFKVSSAFLRLARKEIPDFKINEAACLKEIRANDEHLYSANLILDAKKRFNKVYLLLTDSEKLKLEFER